MAPPMDLIAVTMKPHASGVRADLTLTPISMPNVKDRMTVPKKSSTNVGVAVTRR